VFEGVAEMGLIRKLPARISSGGIMKGESYLWQWGTRFYVSSYAEVASVSEILVVSSDDKGEITDFSEVAGERGVSDLYEEHYRLSLDASD
jgi:hypothetical protein